MSEVTEQSFLEKNKIYLGIAAVVLIAAVVFATLGGGAGTISTQGKVDASKTVKSNVGDTTVGRDALNLESISVGGDFSLDKSVKNEKSEK